MTAEIVSVPAPVGEHVQVEMLWVPCWMMTSEHPYQRDQDPARVAKMENDWSDDMVGAIQIVDNPNYKKTNRRSRLIDSESPGGIPYWVIEGGHRHATAMKKFGGGYQMPCVLAPITSHKRVAEVFLGVNRNRRGVRKLDEYRVGTVAGLEPYVSINKILEARRLGYGYSQQENKIGAVDALVRIYEIDGAKVLCDTLDTLIEAYGYMQAAWGSAMLRGVAEVYGIAASVGKTVDRARLIKILAGNTNRTPKWWEMKGIEVTQSTQNGPSSRGRGVALSILKFYNTGPKADRLPRTRPRRQPAPRRPRVAI